MRQHEADQGPIMRLFTVRTKEGCAGQLLANFATVSADAVQHEPGNVGYFYGQGVAQDDGTVIFASLWRDLDAIKERFGEDWQVSFLPPGYEYLIEECSIAHIELNPGWNTKGDG